MADNQKKSTKTFAVITYAIILVCLLAGLLLPPNFFQGEYNAVVWQIPRALKCVGIDLAKGAELVNPYTVYLWGGEAFELGGLFLLLFAAVCVVALFALFVVLLGKKEKNTALHSAKCVAVLSTVVLSVLLAMQMATFSLAGGYEKGGWNIPLLIAFAGPLVVLFVLSIYEKGGSGFVKTLLTIFSLLAVVLCLFSFAAILPQLSDALKDTLNGNTQLLAWTAEGDPYLGSIWYHLSVPFFENYGDFLGKLGSWDKTVISICMLLLGVLILVNFILDVCGHAKDTTRKMIVANLIRYGVEVLLVLVVLIIGKFVSGYEIGLVCYALIALAALPVVINIFRLLANKENKADKKVSKKREAAATVANEPAYEPELTAYTAPAQPAPKPAAQPAPAVATQTAQPAAQPAPQPAKQQTAAPVAAQTEKVYAPVIYSGPRDKFIDTLSNEEKVEFSRVFLEHRSGNIQGVPDYVLDDENEKFFKSLFIYYARVRGLVSDGLMNKFYEKVSAFKK